RRAVALDALEPGDGVTASFGLAWENDHLAVHPAGAGPLLERFCHQKVQESQRVQLLERIPRRLVFARLRPSFAPGLRLSFAHAFPPPCSASHREPPYFHAPRGSSSASRLAAPPHARRYQTCPDHLPSRPHGAARLPDCSRPHRPE